MKCPYERGVCFVGNCLCNSGWQGQWCDQKTETISCDKDLDCLELSTDRKCSEISKLCTAKEDIPNWKMIHQGSDGKWFPEIKFKEGYFPCGMNALGKDQDMFGHDSKGVVTFNLILCNILNKTDSFIYEMIIYNNLDIRPTDFSFNGLCDLGDFISGIKLQTQIPSIQDEIGVCGIAIKCSNEEDWRILFEYKERCNKKYI